MLLQKCVTVMLHLINRTIPILMCTPETMEDPEDMISVPRDILKVKAETDRNSPTMPLNTDLATKETAFLGPLLRPDSMVTVQPRINVILVPVSAQIVLWTIVIRLIVLLLANIVFIVMGSIIFKLHVFLTLLVHYIES